MFSSEDSKEKFLPLLALVGAIVLVLMGSLAISYNFSQNVESDAQVFYDVPEQSILFMGEIADRESVWEHTSEVVNLYDWDLVVLGGDTVKPGNKKSIQSYVEDLSKTSNKVEVIKGEQDKDDSYFSDSYSAFVENGVQHIFLDTTDAKGIACKLGNDQEKFLERALTTQVEHRIVYMHNAYWVGDKEKNQFRVNNQVDCAYDYWWNKIHPLLKDRVDLVIAGDGRNFNIGTLDGVRYVLNGNIVKPNDELMMRFTRITLQGENIIVTPVDFANSDQVDTSVLDKLPTFEVTVDPELFKEANTKLPFHDIEEKHWLRRLNADENIKYVLPGKVDYLGQEYEIELVSAGKAGNHRYNPKKSWNIEFVDSEKGGPGGRAKLVFRLPGDRGYINQLFVSEINNDQDLLTPNQYVGRLIINNIDFGPYNVFEDFDKEFVELNKYNSDANRGESVLYDEFSAYPIWDNLNYTKVGLKVNDMTQLQKMLAVSDSDNARDFIKYFEEDNYRKWIASQIFTGNRHQSSTHNIKYLIDRATGRLIFVAWDQFYDNIEDGIGEPLAHFDPSTFQHKVLQDPEERKFIMLDLKEFLGKKTEYKQMIADLRAEYEQVFLNDPYTTKSEFQIKSVFDRLESDFDENNIILENLILEEQNK